MNLIEDDNNDGNDGAPVFRNGLTLEVRVRRRTDLGVLIDEGEGTPVVWLPLSQVRLDKASRLDGGFPVHNLHLPEWLALQKGLV